ncbi:MAG: hypothetical protein P9M00_04940 [Candidatus Tritonobacter lacicola]|nr:hypothetical protein [Candidatus Tritonobacter lacicola]
MKTKAYKDELHPITISEPIVILPACEYRELLIEAGYAKVPELEKEISEADIRFRKGKAVPWEKLKLELSKI